MDFSNSSLLYETFEPLDEGKMTTTAKVVFTLHYLMIGMIGNPFMFGLIYYEKYGCDPQKRSLYNQLLSLYNSGILLSVPLVLTINLIRVYFGNLPLIYGHLSSFIQLSSILFGVLVVVQILLYRILQITNYHFIAHLSDAFWVVFLNVFDLVFATVFVLMNILMGHHETPIFFLITGHGDIKHMQRSM